MCIKQFLFLLVTLKCLVSPTGSQRISRGARPARPEGPPRKSSLVEAGAGWAGPGGIALNLDKPASHLSAMAVVLQPPRSLK